MGCEPAVVGMLSAQHGIMLIQGIIREPSQRLITEDVTVVLCDVTIRKDGPLAEVRPSPSGYFELNVDLEPGALSSLAHLQVLQGKERVDAWHRSLAGQKNALVIVDVLVPTLDRALERLPIDTFAMLQKCEAEILARIHDAPNGVLRFLAHPLRMFGDIGVDLGPHAMTELVAAYPAIAHGNDHAYQAVCRQVEDGVTRMLAKLFHEVQP